MRIGLVIPSFDPRRGGAEQWTWQFALLLAKQGHEVHVLATSFGPQVADAPLIRHLLTAGRSRAQFAAAAEQAARRLPLNVVHDMGAGWHCDVFQPHGGSRQAAIEQNLLMSPPWSRPWKRLGMRFLPRYRAFRRLARRQYTADGRLFIALSRMVARDFMRLHDVPRERIRVVYNGVDLDRFSPELHQRHRSQVRKKLGIRDEVLVLIVAHNFALKGVPTLLASVGELVRQGQPLRLVVAGGKRLEPYQRLADQLGAGLATRFVGSVEDASPYYAAADVYVQPTFYDPCSLVVLEALASGLPVITTRFNGAGELMTPGVEGYVMDDPANAAELGSLLRELMEPRKRVEMSQAARSLAMRHSLERNCAEILAVYGEQMGKTSRGIAA
jgi:UDP-glucose:(heptosyl)LPS alpha-1,3-glucosyltransferase